MTGAPSIPSLLVAHWTPAVPLDVLAALAAGLYLTGTGRARRGWPLPRTVAFLAGIGAVLLALQSGLGAYDDELLSVHMVQHLVLLVVAPVLLLAGTPARLALLALPAVPARRRLARCLSAVGSHASPWVCLLVFSAVVLGTHVPGFYDATLAQPALHEAEHAAYLTVGLLLWFPILGNDPAPARRLSGFAQLVYVVVAMLPMALIGTFLSRDPSLFYSAYAAPGRALGVSAVIDQQHAGAIMWVLGGFLMVLVVMWTSIHALLEEERRQQARDRHAATAGGAR